MRTLRRGKLLAILCLMALAALAANLKLYLKDGTYHVVREYKVASDRVSLTTRDSAAIIQQLFAPVLRPMPLYIRRC